MLPHDMMVERQKELGEFGEFALGSEKLDEVLTQACHLVSRALATDRGRELKELLLAAGLPV